MKKILFTLVALLTSAISFAGSPIRVLSGSVPNLADKKVFIEYDYSKMMILDEDTKKKMTIDEFCQMKGEDWVRDKGKDNVDAEGDFAEKLSDKAGKIIFVTDRSKAEYILTVQTTLFSYGNPFAFSAFMSNDVNGFFEGMFFIKTVDGSSVAELHCKKICGPGGMNWTHQKCRVYTKVAQELAPVLKKGK